MSWSSAINNNLRIILNFEFLSPGTCFATGAERMDPSRLPWVMRSLASGWDGRAGGAGGLGGRLYALQAAVAQHPWRGGRYVRSLLHTLREHGMLWHPYQLIRERIARWASYLLSSGHKVGLSIRVSEKSILSTTLYPSYLRGQYNNWLHWFFLGFCLLDFSFYRFWHLLTISWIPLFFFLTVCKIVKQTFIFKMFYFLVWCLIYSR